MSGLGSGQFGTGTPQSQTMGIGGVLNDILSGGAGKLGGSLATLMQNQQQRDTDSLRARFSSGSGSYGSGAQYAESLYKAQAAPQITSAIGNLQLQALSPLLGQYGNLTALGTPQAQTMIQPSEFSQVLGGINAVGGTLSNFKNLVTGGTQSNVQQQMPLSAVGPMNPNANINQNTTFSPGMQAPPSSIGTASNGIDLSSILQYLQMTGMAA